MITNDEAARQVLGRPWAELESMAEELVDQASATVVRWEAGDRDSSRERPEIYADERHGRAPRAPLTRRPKDLSAISEYGLDDKERIVLARTFRSGTSSDDAVVDTTAIWVDATDGGRALLVFLRERARPFWLLRLSRPVYSVGRLTAVESWFSDTHARGGWARETYEYDAEGRVVAADSVRDLGDDVWRTRYYARHDDDGELLTLSYVPLDEEGNALEEPALAYRRRTPGALRPAQRLVEREMPERIRQWAARAAPDEPVYCLAISYSADGFGFVPALGLGTEAERRSWVETCAPADRPELIWNPAEYRCFDPEPAEFTRDAAFAEACQLLAQEWQATLDDAQPRKLLLKVAKQVTAAALPPQVRSTEPFAVVVVDDELEDLDRNLRRLLAKEDRAILEGAATPGPDSPDRR